MIDPGSTEDLSRRAIAVVFAAGLLVGVVGIGAALTVTSLGPDLISLFDLQAQNSDFNVQQYKTSVKGQNSVVVDLTLNNQDAANAHSANVTVQLLDSSGSVVAEQTKQTGSVAGGGQYSGRFQFKEGPGRIPRVT